MEKTKSNDTALLVIDVQVGLIDGLPAYRGGEVLERITELLTAARAAKAPVIYVQHDGPEGHLLERSTSGWEIHPAISPTEADVVVRKRACDAFFETPLRRELEERGITNLVVAGAMTQYCVDTACRRAVSLGYDVTLAGDAHTTGDNEILKAAQIIAHHNALLDGFGAGDHVITVKPSREIVF